MEASTWVEMEGQVRNAHVGGSRALTGCKSNLGEDVMVLASGIRRLRVLAAVGIGLIVLAVVAQPAKADTRVSQRRRDRLEVSISNFVKLLGDGIFITPIAPARLSSGPTRPRSSRRTPASPTPCCDRDRPHQGGLHIEKSSIGQAIDATNVTLVRVARWPAAACSTRPTTCCRTSWRRSGTSPSR